MEPRIAVYRVRNEASGQAKFGHIWLKAHTKVFETIADKKLVGTGEKLDGIWTIDWREPTSEYTSIFGDDMEPEHDYAKDMRERLLKKPTKGASKKIRRAIISNVLSGTWSDNTKATVCKLEDCTNGANAKKYVDMGIESMSTSISPTGYKPPYSILYAPENGL